MPTTAKKPVKKSDSARKERKTIEEKKLARSVSKKLVRAKAR